MYDEILLPTDGSRGAHSAITEGLEIADCHDANVHVLYVNETGDGKHTRSSHRAETDVEDEESVTSEVTARARDADIEFEKHVEVGNPQEVIVDLAVDEEVDAIVLGKKGRTGLKRVLIGSVAEKVVRTAPMTVITVPLSTGEKGYSQQDLYECTRCDNRFQTTADATESVQCPVCGFDDVSATRPG